METDETSKRKRKPRSFYGQAFSKLKGLEQKATDVEGVDEEIILLRIILRQLIEEQPENIKLQLDVINIINRLVKTRHKITGGGKDNSLEEAIHKVLTEVAVPLGINIGIPGPRN